MSIAAAAPLIFVPLSCIPILYLPILLYSSLSILTTFLNCTAMDTDSVQSSFTYLGPKFADITLVNDDSSTFSDCNSDRPGEFPAASGKIHRLLHDNLDELISQLVIATALNSSNVDDRKQAAMEIRLLAKNKPENRIKIAEAGAIRPLISIISSNDAQLQEYGVTAILNLSLCDENKEEIASSGAIKPLVRALKLVPLLRERTLLVHSSDCRKSKII